METEIAEMLVKGAWAIQGEDLKEAVYDASFSVSHLLAAIARGQWELWPPEVRRRALWLVEQERRSSLRAFAIEMAKVQREIDKQIDLAH